MGKRGPKKVDWVPYKDARVYVRRLGLTNYKQWFEYIKTHDLPDGIPRNPQITYGKDYVSDSDFLGTSVYLPYYQAKYFARSLGLKSYTGWLDWHKDKSPDNVPRYPDAVYDEWEGWGEFLGTGTIWNHRRVYRSYDEAKIFAHRLKLKGYDEWISMCRDHPEKLPADIPSSPDAVYDEWEDWKAWLGTSVIGKVAVAQKAINVIYIVREHGVPANVLTIGLEQGGKGAVIDAQRSQLLQILRVYKAEDGGALQRAKFIVTRHGNVWWEGDNQYAIRDINQFLYELDNQFERVP